MIFKGLKADRIGTNDKRQKLKPQNKLTPKNS